MTRITLAAALALACGIAVAAPSPALPQQTPGPLEAAAEEDSTAPPGGWAAAERRMRVAIQLNPEAASLHAALAEAIRRQGRLDEAVEAYGEVVRLEPQSPRYRGGFATLLLEAGRPESAESQYRQALRLDSTRADLHAGLGAALQAQDLRLPAAAAFERAVELDPADSTYRSLLARLRTADEPATERGPGGPMAVLTLLLRFAFAIALGVAGLVLLLPTLAAAFLLIVVFPLSLVRRAPRPTAPATRRES